MSDNPRLDYFIKEAKHARELAFRLRQRSPHLRDDESEAALHTIEAEMWDDVARVGFLSEDVYKAARAKWQTYVAAHPDASPMAFSRNEAKYVQTANGAPDYPWKPYVLRYGVDADVARALGARSDAKELTRFFDAYADAHGVALASPIVRGVVEETVRTGQIPADARAAMERERQKRQTASQLPKETPALKRLVMGETYWTKIGGTWQEVVAVDKVALESRGKRKWHVRVRRPGEDRILPKSRLPQSLKKEKPAAGAAFKPVAPPKKEVIGPGPNTMLVHLQTGGRERVKVLHGGPDDAWVATSPTEGIGIVLTHRKTTLAAGRGLLEKVSAAADYLNKHPIYDRIGVAMSKSGAVKDPHILALAKNINDVTLHFMGDGRPLPPVPESIAPPKEKKPTRQDMIAAIRAEVAAKTPPWNIQRKITNDFDVKLADLGKLRQTIAKELSPALREEYADEQATAVLGSYGALSKLKNAGYRFEFGSTADSVKAELAKSGGMILGSQVSVTELCDRGLKLIPPKEKPEEAQAKRDEIGEMRDLLAKHGYPKGAAEKLRAEGMGPHELLDRLGHQPGSVGSLDYTHNIRPVRRPSEEIRKARVTAAIAEAAAKSAAAAPSVLQGPPERPAANRAGHVTILQEKRVDYNGRRYLVKEIRDPNAGAREKQVELYVVGNDGLEEWVGTKTLNEWGTYFQPGGHVALQHAMVRALRGEYKALPPKRDERLGSAAGSQFARTGHRFDNEASAKFEDATASELESLATGKSTLSAASFQSPGQIQLYNRTERGRAIGNGYAVLALDGKVHDFGGNKAAATAYSRTVKHLGGLVNAGMAFPPRHEPGVVRHYAGSPEIDIEIEGAPAPPALTDRPLAAPGLTSYRARGRYGWVMIGAKDAEEALREAKRSTPSPESLQVWNGQRYVDVSPSSSPSGPASTSKAIVLHRDAHAHRGAEGHLSVRLSENETAVVASMKDAADVVRAFIERNGLGSEAWHTSQEIGAVRDAKDHLVGKISYNGRIWGPSGEALSPPTLAERPRPQLGAATRPRFRAHATPVYRNKKTSRGRKEKTGTKCGPGIQGCVLVREYWRKQAQKNAKKAQKDARVKKYRTAVERNGKMVANGPIFTDKGLAEAAAAMLGGDAEVIEVKE